MPDQENEIQNLESQFPPVSGSAFAAARERVLGSGQSVLQSEGGFIFRVFPDGRKEVVKQIERPTVVTPRHQTQDPMNAATPRMRMFVEVQELKTSRIPSWFKRAVLDRI